MQRATLELALDVLQTAFAPRTTVQTPFVWSAGSGWRENYMRVDDSNIEELRRAGRERRERQANTKAEGRARTA